MRTRSAGHATTTPRGGRTGGRTGRGGGRTSDQTGDQGNSVIDGQGGQIGGQGNEVNDGDDGVPNFFTIIAQQLQNLLLTILAQGDVRYVIVNNDRMGCTYKEFLACNPKEYDGKGGAIVSTRWIVKMESVQDMSRCGDNQKVKYTAGSFVGKALTWLVSRLVSPKNKSIERYIYGISLQIQGMVAATEPETIQRAVQKAKTLTDEAVKNGSLKKNPKKRGNGEDPNRYKIMRDEDKRTRTGNAFATATTYADYSFVSTTFIPLLGIEPCELRFSYEIEIASGQLVEINKVIRGLPPIRKIEFRIELIPRAIPVTNSPYRLAPSEMEDLSGQLKELQDMGFIRPSLSPWGAQALFVKKKDDPSKIEAVKNWKAPRSPSEGEEREREFQTLKDKLCNAPVLALLEGPKDFVSIIKDMILAAQKEASDEPAEMQRGMDELMGCRSDEAFVLLGSNMGSFEGDRYWWPRIKKAIVVYVRRCLTCLKERIAMDFVTKLLKTSSGHDAIWVILDRLTKSAHFIHMHKDYKMDRLARLYLNEIVARHGVPVSIIFDRDSRFTSRFWQSMQEALGTRLDMSTAYHPQTDDQSECTIQTLEDMLRACVFDFEESWDVHLLLIEFSYNNAPELVQETTKKISHIKNRLKDAHDDQISYADKKRKPLEFSVAPRFVGPFEIIERIDPIAYRLILPKELNGVHDTFHVSNLKNCLVDPTLEIPLDEIQVDAKLNVMEETVEILEREFKKLKRIRIAIVKVR
nr:hypothetical protein [Tanacetum cinerariifolium]